MRQGGHRGEDTPLPGSGRGRAGALTHGGLAGLAEGVVGEALHEAGLAHPPRPDDDHLQLEVGRARRLLPAAGLAPGERRRPPRRARPEVQPAAPRPALRQPRARLHQRRMRRRAAAALPPHPPRSRPPRQRRPRLRGRDRSGQRGRDAVAARPCAQPGPRRTATATGTGTAPPPPAGAARPTPRRDAQRPLQRRSRGPAPQCRGRRRAARPALPPGLGRRRVRGHCPSCLSGSRLRAPRKWSGEGSESARSGAGAVASRSVVSSGLSLRGPVRVTPVGTVGSPLNLPARSHADRTCRRTPCGAGVVCG